MDREDAEHRIERFRTIENLLRTHAQGMAALHVEQQKTQTVITQLLGSVNSVDAFGKAVDLRLTTITEGVADRYEKTLRAVGMQCKSASAPASATAELRYWFAGC